jgi:hypothetical protein
MQTLITTTCFLFKFNFLLTGFNTLDSTISFNNSPFYVKNLPFGMIFVNFLYTQQQYLLPLPTFVNYLIL